MNFSSCICFLIYTTPCLNICKCCKKKYSIKQGPNQMGKLKLTVFENESKIFSSQDDENKFDMLVRNCVAHDGKRAPIQLVDELGCVTRPKIMSKFQKIKNFGSSASVVSYAYFQAFKFPDSMNVHFQCVIQVKDQTGISGIKRLKQNQSRIRYQ